MTITAPEKATQHSIASDCVPGVLRVILYKFEQIDMVVLSCNQYTYVRLRAHTAMLYYTQHAFLI